MEIEESELSEAVARQKAPPKKSHTCTFCNMVFHKAAKLTVHLYTHTGERPFQCSVCGKSYSRNTHLTRHVLQMHTPASEKPVFECKSCHSHFATKYALENHKTSSCGSNLLCTLCGLVASSKWHLGKHTVAKHGPGQQQQSNKATHCAKYQCYEGCELAFENRELRRKHIESCHGYLCADCGVKLSSASQRRDHCNANHRTKLKCDQCDSVLTTAYSLQQHVRSIHLGMRLECSTCHQKFSTRSSLRRHIRTTHQQSAPNSDSESSSGNDDGSVRHMRPAKRPRYAKAVLNRLLGQSSDAPEMKAAPVEYVPETSVA